MLIIRRDGGFAVGLNRPTQQLRRELRDIADRSENACIDLTRIALDLTDAQALELLSMVGTMYEDSDRLRMMADSACASVPRGA